MTAGLLAYALAWASFGAGHSLLALPGPKAWLRARVGRAMRLVWNLIALAHLALALAVGLALVPAVPLPLPGWWGAVRLALGAAGVAVLWAASRSYHMGRLSGLAQLRGETADDDEPFSARGLLAYVRHPLYSGLLLLLAAGVADVRSAATAAFAALYILVGYRFEERGLLRRLGAEYAAWRARVPALFPWRGRAWPP